MMTTANWCVLAAIVLPYVCFGIARNRGRAQGVHRDNRNPRDFPNHITGVARRAWGAHLNALEALPAFAAAVIIAQIGQAPQGRVDALAVTWVVVRIAHVAFYLSDRDKLRTAASLVGLACVLGLFVVTALA